MGLLRKLIIFFIILFAVPCFATTYYSDYVTGVDSNDGLSTASGHPWKNMPGMSGWTGSATLSSGDTVVLKGGSTWSFASTTANLITPACPITIMGGQLLSTPWGSGYPLLDATGTTVGARAGVWIVGISNITINGLEFAHLHGTASNQGGKGIAASGVTSNLTVSNNYFLDDGDKGFYSGISAGNVVTNISIFGNIFESEGQLVTIYINDTATVSNLYIYKNEFRGNGGATSNSHGDGIMIGSACTTADGSGNSTCFQNIQIYQNLFHGDWSFGATALIDLQNGTASTTGNVYGGAHALIYDNVIGLDLYGSGAISPGMFVVYSLWNDIKIYNNTFGTPYVIGGTDGVGSPVTQCIVFNDAATAIDIENNILSGCVLHGIGSTPTATFVAINNNLYSPDVASQSADHGIIEFGATNCSSPSVCYTKFGYEANGLQSDPLFVQRPDGVTDYLGNWNIQSTSPAIGVGANLSSIFTTDILGVTWTVPWGIGAYQYNAGATYYTLTVTSGTGTPTITSSPVGISCGPTCSHLYASGTAVTLTSTCSQYYQNPVYSGACTGGSCSVTMSAAEAVTVNCSLIMYFPGRLH